MINETRLISTLYFLDFMYTSTTNYFFSIKRKRNRFSTFLGHAAFLPCICFVIVFSGERVLSQSVTFSCLEGKKKTKKENLVIPKNEDTRKQHCDTCYIYHPSRRRRCNDGGWMRGLMAHSNLYSVQLHEWKRKTLRDSQFIFGGSLYWV